MPAATASARHYSPTTTSTSTNIGHPVDTVVTTPTTRDFLTRRGYRPALPLHSPGSPPLWPLRRAGRPVPLTASDGNVTRTSHPLLAE